MVLINPFNIYQLVLSSVIFIHWIQLHNHSLPKWLKNAYAYGKTVAKDDSKIGNGKGILGVISLVIQKPIHKSVFKHFYEFAISFNLLLLVTLPIFPDLLSPILTTLFRVFDEEVRGVNSLSCGSNVFWTVFILELIMMVKRCYECHFIMIFSPEAKMTLLQTFLSFFYYAVFSMALVNLRVSSLNSKLHPILSTFGVILFVIGFCSQFYCHLILRDLRKGSQDSNKKDDNTARRYKIPRGFAFDYVSSPHYTAEIVVYIGLWLISNFDSGIGFMLLQVIANLLMLGELSHQWYQSTFQKKLPSKWRILIPSVI